jgi:hypothetical protein
VCDYDVKISLFLIKLRKVTIDSEAEHLITCEQSQCFPLTVGGHPNENLCVLLFIVEEIRFFSAAIRLTTSTVDTLSEASRAAHPAIVMDVDSSGRRSRYFS